MDTIDKKIYFYRILMKKIGKVVTSDKVFSKINTLPFTNGERYLDLENENSQCMYIEPIKQPLRANIGTVRTKNLPMTEQKGVQDPLNLPPGVGLYEGTHFVIFSNNVMGAEYNYYGPRISCLKNYIPSKVPSLVDEVELIPIMRHDFMEQISKIGEIKKFRMKIQSDNIILTEKLNANLHSMFEQAKRVAYDTEDLDITLNLSHNMKLSMLDKLSEWLPIPEVLSSLSVLKIHAKNEETRKMETFDLLQDYMLSVKPVNKKDELHRSVDKNSMYNAIESSYDELKSEINSVIGNEK
ncbi:hypothetical protein MSBRW_1211 [Methanosarcina barkeri str. Wiesmoor]|uniref:Uncharacterized protein n=2 Tax=Methanosarcina barkeri TaxID=2208 RepID=A0A0E3QID7_METBA|nr:hypothetical protein [Methanosarcina barkeri]AKB50464.1 hypothetical protein MSBRW_1211 [Methanosarcina barkeri str. Wiesmoor]